VGLAFPKTGRQHQIRVHAMAHDFPLIGDKLYLAGYEYFSRYKDGLGTVKDQIRLRLPRQALHALSLKLAHHHFHAPLPSDLTDWLEAQEMDLKLINEKIQTVLKKKSPGT
jgi:23S rRNA-/tRNA-specific pseudouridylate synthase